MGLGEGTYSGKSAIAFFTIIARNYLAQALCLTQSIRRFYPTAEIYVALVDRVKSSLFTEKRDFNWVLIDDLSIKELDSFCFKYTTLELSTAIKPRVFEYIFKHSECKKVVYLDPDTWLLRRLEPVELALDLFAIALTPHVTTPILDASGPTELDLLRAGTFNLGFIALRRSSMATRLLEWWSLRLYEFCRMDIERGMHVDQRWMDLVPSFFPNVAILRDSGLNVAYWNLRQRLLLERDGSWFIDLEPAYFFHFSGFSPSESNRLSRHFYPQSILLTPALKKLHTLYSEVLEKNGYSRHSTKVPFFERFSNGEKIPDTLRKAYAEMAPGERTHFGNPFNTSGANSLLSWWQGRSYNQDFSMPRIHRMQCHHDVSRIPPQPGHNLIKQGMNGIRKLGARCLAPILQRQTSFNSLSLEEIAELRRRVNDLGRQVQSLERKGT